MRRCRVGAAHLIEQAAGALGHYRFSHALIRDALDEELPSSRRARLHLWAAEALEALSGPPGAGHVAELAAHYRLALPVSTTEKAVAYARRAGDRAAALFAWEEAISQWQTALELAGPDDWCGRCEQAKESFLQAADAVRHPRRAGGDEAGRGVSYLARAALGYGGPGVALGTLDQRQVSLLEEALAAGLPAPDGMCSGPAIETLAPDQCGLCARLLARLALALFWTPRRPESLAHSREAVPRPARATTRGR